jgi:hypothetical protein
MQDSFGRDFSGVVVRTDPNAAGAARRLGARAVSIGDEISFAPGEYAPHTAEGRALVAHELAHVAQRSSSGPSASIAAAEHDADRAAALALQGRRASVRATVAPAVPLMQTTRERLGEESDRQRGIGRSILYPRTRRDPYPFVRRREEADDQPLDQAATEALLQAEVAKLRPTIPHWTDLERMGSFDSHKFYGVYGPFNFRGRVMLGWEVNYYFVTMALAHQGWDWNEVQAVVWTWNQSQDLGLNPWGGAGEMTPEMWFVVEESFWDEHARMATD